MIYMLFRFNLEDTLAFTNIVHGTNLTDYHLFCGKVIKKSICMNNATK